MRLCKSALGGRKTFPMRFARSGNHAPPGVSEPRNQSNRRKKFRRAVYSENSKYAQTRSNDRSGAIVVSLSTFIHRLAVSRITIAGYFACIGQIRSDRLHRQLRSAAQSCTCRDSCPRVPRRFNTSEPAITTITCRTWHDARDDSRCNVECG
jgi:hypothetical protein